MSVWLVRAGKHGEYEQKFLQENRVYLTWSHLAEDLAAINDRERLHDVMTKLYADAKPNTVRNWVSQVWPFAHEIKKGDLVVVPLKTQPAISIGEVTGDYHFDAGGPDPFHHWRTVKWIAEAVPRANFGKDLLHSFGAFMTICRIQRNHAEERLIAMRAAGWKPESLVPVRGVTTADSEDAVADTDFDIEEAAGDQIARLIMQRFTGHGLTRLVEAVLRAQGYTTYRSPEGADGGVDILAGAGPLGFGKPKLCVQVKSGASPVDRPTVDNLLGVMTKFQADEGLFVSWSNFKSTVQKDLAQSFFKVRLWNRNDLLAQLFAHYDQLDDDLKAELPLKRIWTVAAQDDEE